MATRDILVQRFSTVSSHSFREVVNALLGELGHPNIAEFNASIGAATKVIDSGPPPLSLRVAE